MARIIQHQLLRLQETLEVRGQKKSNLYADIRRGLMTSSVALGTKLVGWPASEVDAINAARIAGKSPDEIRDLVTRLETARSDALEEAFESYGITLPSNVRAIPERRV